MQAITITDRVRKRDSGREEDGERQEGGEDGWREEIERGRWGGRRRRGEGDEREITLFMCVTYTGLLLFFSKKFL